ncbi:MAG: hypothetical protein IKF71_04345 [Bacilli bacterium]|nr:hypothetical protein [Bacilli bacterium]
MNDSRIINNKIAENISEIKQSRLKKLAASVGAILLTGTACMATVAVHAMIAEFTLPALLLGAIVPIAAVGYARCKNSQIKSARTQNKHLRSIYSNGVAQSPELTRKKSMQIAKLEEKQQDIYDSLTTDSALMAGGIAGWVIGSISSLVATPMVIATVGGLVTFAIAVNKIAKDENKLYECDAHIENLKNDLVLGPIYKPRKTNNQNTTGMNRPPMKSRPMNNQTQNNNRYAKAVDDYVERYSTLSSQLPPRQKIKR